MTDNKTCDDREALRQAIAAGLSDLASGKSQPLNPKTLEALKVKG
jgi:hypothetical protein